MKKIRLFFYLWTEKTWTRKDMEFVVSSIKYIMNEAGISTTWTWQNICGIREGFNIWNFLFFFQILAGLNRKLFHGWSVGVQMIQVAIFPDFFAEMIFQNFNLKINKY